MHEINNFVESAILFMIINSHLLTCGLLYFVEI